MALVVKNLAADKGETREGFNPWVSGRPPDPWGRHGNPHQYSCLENLMDRGPWQTMSTGLQKRLTQLTWLSTYTCTNYLEDQPSLPQSLEKGSIQGLKLIQEVTFVTIMSSTWWKMRRQENMTTNLWQMTDNRERLTEDPDRIIKYKFYNNYT